MESNGTIKWLAELDRSARAVAGGKGANLGEMARAGLPMPPGFVVTTAGYRHFVESNQLQAQIVALAAGLETAVATDYEAVSSQIRDLFVAGAMPKILAQAIGAAYGELVDGATGGEKTAVAVRSSATA
ncbi:MAG TPA: PEP/pyruvate-binding domain-containing protein, partial [Anaerolineae bacterium]